jgi:ubiquinone biosynthesis protein UbiJ
MTKELMLKKVNEEISVLREQAKTLSEVVSELEQSTRADAATTTVEKIAKVLDDVDSIRPSLERLRKTLKARILERLK